LDNHFLKDAKERKVLLQDELKLGIQTNISDFTLKNTKGQPQVALYTLGANLRGELWESTAVNELRQQAKSLAAIIVNTM
jgi:uncharacterized NAD(P)/FAD-binding protein YdhS